MDKRLKQNLTVTVVGVCLFAALMNLASVLGFLQGILDIILPIIVGAIIALFLEVPVNGMQKHLKKWTKKWKKKPSDEKLRAISFFIVLFCIVWIVVLVFMLLVPELVKSVKSSYSLIEQRIPEWLEYLESHNISTEFIEESMDKLDITSMLREASGSIDIMLSTASGALTSTVSGIATAGFGLIIGFYLVLGAKRTKRHTYKFIYGFISKKWADRIYHVSRLFKKSFSNFLTGQCTEAIILGTMMFIAFSIFRLPYAMLVGVVTAFCAIIPYVGAFISCVVSIVLTLLLAPQLVLRTAMVYLCVQFVENQFIYPRVVGGSVGMPALYTLIAAMIGGKLFGIIGILFFIPIMAVVIEVTKEVANRRLGLKPSDL